eukprot:gene26943-48401_t
MVSGQCMPARQPIQHSTFNITDAPANRKSKIVNRKSEIELSVKPEHAFDETYLLPYLREKLGKQADTLRGYRIRKRSIDARGGRVRFNLRVMVYVDSDIPAEEPF